MASNITSVAGLSGLNNTVVKFKEPGSGWQFAYVTHGPSDFQGGGHGYQAVLSGERYQCYALVDTRFAQGLVVQVASAREKRNLTWPSNVHPS